MLTVYIVNKYGICIVFGAQIWCMERGVDNV